MSTGPSSTTNRRAAFARARGWFLRHWRRSTGLLAAGLAVAPVVLLSSGTASQAASAGTQMVPTVLAGLPLATSLGAAPAGQVLTIGVSLQRPNTAGEQQLYSELYNPSSPGVRAVPHPRSVRSAVRCPRGDLIGGRELA
jgi:hypothetical protein